MVVERPQATINFTSEWILYLQVINEKKIIIHQIIIIFVS